jgi:amino acid adenylation domain-containing protein
MVYLLQHLLAESAYKYPEKEAILFQDEKITYAELESESNELAHGFIDLGIKRGDRVGIYMNRGITSIVAAFAVLKAGATYVPIDPLCPPVRLSYILDKCQITILATSQEKLINIEHNLAIDSDLKCIIVMNAIGPVKSSLKTTNIINWNDIRKTITGYNPLVPSINSDIAYILFTSGSTGNPKGVMLSHLNALTFIDSAHDFFQIKPEDRFSNISPLHFDMSIFDLYVAFKAGATVVIIPETSTFFPVKLAEAIVQNKITVWNSVPSALSILATYKNLDSYDLSSLRLVLFAGEQFPLKYLRRLQEIIPEARFCNMYGQTEANSSTYYWVEKLASDATSALPIGKPLPNFDVFALGEDGKQVTEPKQEGELYVRASTVSLGYLGEIEKTEKSFVKNPLNPGPNERVYRTGDLVRLDAAGNYVFLGRKDFMIKSRGYRIEIGEIETVLCNHPEIKNAIVIPIPDELIGNRIWLCLVPLTPGKLGIKDIFEYCNLRLPKYMIPETIKFYGSLPTTASGKIDRKKMTDNILNSSQL